MTILAGVAVSGMARNGCDEQPRVQASVETFPVSAPKAPMLPDLNTVRETTHTELTEALTFMDGNCHLKDPAIETVLSSLKALDPKLLDSYIDSQLSVCAEK